MASKTMTRAAKEQPKKTKEDVPEPVGSDENEANDGGDEEEPKTARKAGKKLLDTVKQETSARTAGLANTVTGLVKLISDVAGLFGSLGREQMDNARRVAQRKHDLLSRAGKNVAGGLINAIDSVHEVGGVGAQTALGLLRDTTETGKTAVQTGGALLSAPVQMARHGMDLIRRAIRVPPTITKTVSDALGACGSREAAGEEFRAEDEDDTPEPSPPPPPPPSPRTAPKSKRK